MASMIDNATEFWLMNELLDSELESSVVHEADAVLDRFSLLATRLPVDVIAQLTRSSISSMTNL